MDSADTTNSIERTEGDALREQEELVRGLIEEFRRLAPDERKARMSISDLIRLLQFQRELEKERPADIIEVRWIDPKPGI